MDKKGITLIAVIILMTLLAIVALSLISFVIERQILTTVRQNEINAYYMAQAGIYYGIYQYMEDSGITSGTYDAYTDRGFDWIITPIDADSISIRSTGYSHKTGSRMQKILQATYNTSSRALTGLRYGT